MRLHIGFERGTGEPVEIELSMTSPHVAVFGQTGLGKTILVRRLIEEIPKDYRVLVFDTREGVEEFHGEGHHAPIYVQETTDPLVLKGLLESIIKSSLKREYATLVRVAEGTEDYAEVVDRLGDKIADKKTHAVVKDMCILLRDLLQRLMVEIRETETAPDVDLRPGLNVMRLNDRSKQFKQLTVRAVLPLVYRKYRKLVVFLDEGQEFIPQKYTSAAAEAVDDYIRTARGKDDYMVIAAQSITGTNKDPLKSCHTWVHLGQATRGEAKEALEYIPHADKIELTIREIQTMSTGFAVVNTKSWAKRTYVRPTWLREDLAIEIAKSGTIPKEILKYEAQVAKHMDEQERKKLEDELNQYVRLAADRQRQIESLTNTLNEQRGMIDQLQRDLKAVNVKRSQEAENRILDQTKRAMEEASKPLPFPATEPKSPIPAELHVPPILEGDIDLDTLAAKVGDMVEARILAKIPRGQKVEVPPPRIVLTKLLQDEVDRIKAKISALNVMQKKMLAYVAAKKTTQKYGDVQKAVAGYVSGPYRELLVAIRDTGLMTADTQHSTVRYAGRELVEQDLRGRYDLTDEDVENVLAAIENEFAHFMTGG